MKTIKTIKWMIAIWMAFGMAATSYGQNAENTPVSQAKQLQAQLSLTDVQTTKITEIYAQNNKAIANDKAKLIAWQAAHNTKAIISYELKQLDLINAQIEPILTADQKIKYKQLNRQAHDYLNKLAAEQQ